jgi:hypothetical protein
MMNINLGLVGMNLLIQSNYNVFKYLINNYFLMDNIYINNEVSGIRKNAHVRKEV